MKKSLALALALAAAPFAASAGEPSYTYVEGGYAKLHIDEDDLDSPEADGGFVRGSVALGDSFHLIGGISRVGEDYRFLGERIDVDVTQYELGVGYHLAMGERVSFTADLAYLRYDLDTDVQGYGEFDEQATGGRLGVGIRGQFNDQFEGWVKANYYDGGDFEDETVTGVVGAQFKFNPTWGLMAEIEHGEVAEVESTKYLVGVRASF